MCNLLMQLNILDPQIKLFVQKLNQLCILI
jgi:hypothetical protein